MATPAAKSTNIAELLEGFCGRTSAILGNVCVDPPIGCGGPATEFRDGEDEYRISGLCQDCQDTVFSN